MFTTRAEQVDCGDGEEMGDRAGGTDRRAMPSVASSAQPLDLANSMPPDAVAGSAESDGEPVSRTVGRGRAGVASCRASGQIERMGRLITAGRMAWLLARFGGGRLMQPSTVTSANRHPELFDHVRQALADVAAPSVLSFGCSTGEEVFTLGAMMPDGHVRGIDINRACIRQAQRRLAAADNGRLSFARAASAAGEPTAGYDAIFALSVLRHGRLEADQPEDCSAILPFARFARSIADLDRCLKPGGLLVVWGSHFRLCDTDVQPRYAVELARPYPPALPVYGADNRRLADPGLEQIVFRKRNEAGIIAPIQ